MELSSPRRLADTRWWTDGVFAGDLSTGTSEVVRVTNGTLFLRRRRCIIIRAASWWRTKCASFASAQRRYSARRAHRAKLGAEGNRLCRTEHMFFGAIASLRMRDDRRSRRRRPPAGAKQLLPCSAADFEGIFGAMDGLPGHNPGLLDPPLHEFLPPVVKRPSSLPALSICRARTWNRIIESLRETTPMLGHRGCRLGISYPEITEMQARAILERGSRDRRVIVVKPES